jgi:hypothetical protein
VKRDPGEEFNSASGQQRVACDMEKPKLTKVHASWQGFASTTAATYICTQPCYSLGIHRQEHLATTITNGHRQHFDMSHLKMQYKHCAL